MQTIRVDLKWFLWTADRWTWEAHSPGTWLRMRAAFLGTAPPVEVMTAPRKEIRYGRVVIERGRARGLFACEWDEPADLASTLGVPDEDLDLLFEDLPFTVNSEPGTDRSFDISRSKGRFLRLMRAIDSVENDVVSESDALWRDVESAWKK